jgi:hypothetical protein
MLSKTKWFVKIEQLSNYYRNRFFILGTLMVIVFIIFSPSNTIEIILGGYGRYRVFLPIVLYWSIIIGLVILFLPITSKIRDSAIDRIITQFTETQAKEYEKKALKSSADEVYKYLSTLEFIKTYSECFESKNNKKLVPIFTTALNFISIFIAMVSDLKDLFA